MTYSYYWTLGDMKVRNNCGITGSRAWFHQSQMNNPPFELSAEGDKAIGECHQRLKTLGALWQSFKSKTALKIIPLRDYRGLRWIGPVGFMAEIRSDLRK